MKVGIAILVIVVLIGCSSEGVPRTPTAPAPSVTPTPTVGSALPPVASTPTGSALLWVMVIDKTGACIDAATIQMVGTQGAGEPIPQRTPCSAWDDDGGLLLTNLTPGVELTLRGAATGYNSGEMTFLPFPMPGSYHAVFIRLSKAP